MDMVESAEELKSSRSIAGKIFPEFRNAGLENRFSFEQDHPKFRLQEEGQSRGPERPERGPVSSWKTDRLHGLRLFSSNWRS